MVKKNTMLHFFTKKILFALFFVPGIALAQGRTIKSAAYALVEFLTRFVSPFLFAIALMLFIWGIIIMVQNGDNPEQRKRGQSRMLWGIIGLLAMVGYLGMTAILTQSVFSANPIIPQLFTGK